MNLIMQFIKDYHDNDFLKTCKFKLASTLFIHTCFTFYYKHFLVKLYTSCDVLTSMFYKTLLKHSR